MRRNVSFLVILLVILMAFSFLGCSRGKKSSSEAKTTEVAADSQSADRSLGSSGTTNSGSAGVSVDDIKSELISYDFHRYALVIGNNKYEEGALANPVNDAKLIAEKLSEAGFNVYSYQNLDKNGMDDAVSSFVKVVNDDTSATAVVYYAGHGVEVDGVNYLIPVNNRKIGSEADVKIYAYSLDNILSLLDAKEQIIILDACRNNPFKMSGNRAAGVKGGLGALKEAKKGVTMSYLFAAQSGETAKDGDGKNSLFTTILSEELAKSSLPLYEIFNNVASRVRDYTSGEQIPLFSSTGSQFVFQSEILAESILAQWAVQLKAAQEELDKINKSKDNSNSVELAAAQAKLALIEAENEAARKRAEQMKKDAENAALEAEVAKSRNAELQARIDAMKSAAENAATQIRMNSSSVYAFMDAINEIEFNKAKIVEINAQIEELIEIKSVELSKEYAQKASEIDMAEYQKAELGSNGQPTAAALSNRQIRKNALKAEYDALLEDYISEITTRMKGSDTGILSIINSETVSLGKTTYTMSSLTGGITFSIEQYDGNKGGWTLSYEMGNLINPKKIFLSYEALTGMTKYSVLTDASQYSTYQEYLDNVDMFDSMFRGDVPVIEVEVKCHVIVDAGTLTYQIMPDSLVVRRIDTDKVVFEQSSSELQKAYGKLTVKSSTGLDIRKTDEIVATRISTDVTVQYRDGTFVEDMVNLYGWNLGNWLTEVKYTTSVVVVDGYRFVYSVGDIGPAGGIIIYDCDADNENGKAGKDGLISTECGWRYLEASPYDTDYSMWGDKKKCHGKNKIGKGESNTAKILSKASKKRPENAATECDEFTYGGYDDWFLPSKAELKLMRKVLKGTSYKLKGRYWSSSDNFLFRFLAWKQWGGLRYLWFKGTSNGKARPIRSF